MARAEERRERPLLWEEHAGWWQDGFTDGADPEYEEQILPLAAEHLAGAAGCSTSGAARGRSPGSPRPAAPTLVVGVDPTRAQIGGRERGGGPAYAAAGADALPFPDGSLRRRRRVPRDRAHPDVDAAIAEVARVLRPGGRFLFFLNHPLLQTPGSGWIDDHILDPPEQYWRIGPYLVEDETIEEVEHGVFIPFIHRPLSRYVNVMAANGLLIERMDEPAPPPGLPGPGPGVRRRRHDPAVVVPPQPQDHLKFTSDRYPEQR